MATLWISIAREFDHLEEKRVLTSHSAQQAIIDTGTTLIGGQDTVIDAILGNVDGAVKGEQVASKMRGFYALREFPVPNYYFYH